MNKLSCILDCSRTKSRNIGGPRAVLMKSDLICQPLTTTTNYSFLRNVWKKRISGTRNARKRIKKCLMTSFSSGNGEHQISVSFAELFRRIIIQVSRKTHRVLHRFSQQMYIGMLYKEH